MPASRWWSVKAGLAWLTAPVSGQQLIIVRIGFGVLMLISTLRYLAMGWVETLLLQPAFHFTYWGFSWVRPLPAPLLYGVFGVMALCAVGIAVGAWYRWACAGFLLTFTYIELLDKSYYLNHYYFIVVFGVILALLPLNGGWAWDSWRNPALRRAAIPRWMLIAVQLQVGLIYFYAGVAKLNPDWVFQAMPLRLWLPPHADLPLLGPLLAWTPTAYGMSWAGVFYDLSIPFLLVWQRTRLLAYGAVVAFHLLTALLFPIGMFPWVMMLCSLVFWQGTGKVEDSVSENEQVQPTRQKSGYLLARVLVLLLVTQLLLPLRHTLYPGDVLWTEEGFRYSWRVMVVEKMGTVIYTLRDGATGRSWQVYPGEYLTPAQAKQMAFQPDMILEFAHFLRNKTRTEGITEVEVRAEAYVTWNGRPSRLLIDPTVDLAQEEWTLGPKGWILQYP